MSYKQTNVAPATGNMVFRCQRQQVYSCPKRPKVVEIYQKKEDFHHFRENSRLLVLGHEGLDVVGIVGDAVLAEEAAAVVGDEDVVLDADATEVLVGLQQVEV